MSEAMDASENLFVADPFLSLDVDLDDLSDVIRRNAIDEKLGRFDKSQTPSPVAVAPQAAAFSTAPTTPIDRISAAQVGDARRQLARARHSLFA